MSTVEYLGKNKPINKVTPLVSVCIPTYQHAGYIAQCLDSVLSQETSFPIEILVGEDQSTDGTREICIAYAEKFSDKIRLFLNDRNDIICFDGKPSGRTNFLNLYSEARGKYISICEGDDYWTDKTKLERQVAIFRENPECSLVFHNATFIGDYRNGKEFCTGLVEGFYDIESVISKPWFVPTQSMLFRKDLLELGEWFKHTYNGDFTIQLMLAARFPFYFVDKTMSAYRIHAGGTGSIRASDLFYDAIKKIETLTIFNCVSEFKYDQLIKIRMEAIRSWMLTSSSEQIKVAAIQSMSWWEKALTFRYYILVFQYLASKLK